MTLSLEGFVEDWNNDELSLDHYSPGYGVLVDESYARQFQHETNGGSPGLRVSSLGNYGIVQAIRHVAWNTYRRPLREPETIGRKAAIFHTGDVVEGLLMTCLEAYGFKVTNKQDEVNWNSVTGHPDGVINDDTVIDVKTSSSGNFKRYMKAPPLTYTTQLAVYADCLNTPKAALLFYNKDNCELGLRYIEPAVRASALERAAEIVEATFLCHSIEDVYERFQVPAPLEEVFQKRPTGRFYAPSDLYTPFPDLLYERVADTTGYGDERQYIVGLRTAQQVHNLLGGY